MRKIAANYIFLPGYALVKNGYVVLEGTKVVEVVNTDGILREIQGLEFYGGMIVSATLCGKNCRERAGMSLLTFLAEAYRQMVEPEHGLAIIIGADLQHLVFCEGTEIVRLV